MFWTLSSAASWWVRRGVFGDPQDRCGAPADGAGMAGIKVEHGGRAECGLDGGDRLTATDRDGAQVSGDRVVDGVLEQLGPGAGEGLNDLDRDARLIGAAGRGASDSPSMPWARIADPPQVSQYVPCVLRQMTRLRSM
jgi:hypothetical protein